MNKGKKIFFYETKFDLETRTFSGWNIFFEDEINQKIKGFNQYRFKFSQDY